MTADLHNPVEIRLLSYNFITPILEKVDQQLCSQYHSRDDLAGKYCNIISAQPI